MDLSCPHDNNREKLCCTALYHVRLNGMRSNGRLGPHLFAGAASGPRNLYHHDTMSGYGFITSTTAMAGHHHDDDYANARTKRKASNRNHLRAFSFYFRTSRYCNLTFRLHTIKGERGTLNRGERDKKTMPSNGNVLSTHLKTLKHTHS
jgi:hypothetical protein